MKTPDKILTVESAVFTHELIKRSKYKMTMVLTLLCSASNFTIRISKSTKDKIGASVVGNKIVLTNLYEAEIRNFNKIELNTKLFYTLCYLAVRVGDDEEFGNHILIPETQTKRFEKISIVQLGK